jgi:hypothetical protein
MSDIPRCAGKQKYRIVVQASLGIKQDSISKITKVSQAWWLTPVILATQEAEIRKILV